MFEQQLQMFMEKGHVLRTYRRFFPLMWFLCMFVALDLALIASFALEAVLPLQALSSTILAGFLSFGLSFFVMHYLWKRVSLCAPFLFSRIAHLFLKAEGPWHIYGRTLALSTSSFQAVLPFSALSPPCVQEILALMDNGASKTALRLLKEYGEFLSPEDVKEISFASFKTTRSRLEMKFYDRAHPHLENKQESFYLFLIFKETLHLGVRLQSCSTQNQGQSLLLCVIRNILLPSFPWYLKRKYAHILSKQDIAPPSLSFQDMSGRSVLSCIDAAHRLNRMNTSWWVKHFKILDGKSHKKTYLKVFSLALWSSPPPDGDVCGVALVLSALKKSGALATSR